MEILAALFLGVLTLFPVVTTESSPIKLKCEVAYITASGIVTSQMQYTNGVTVTAVNTSPKTVTSFTVNGSYNKSFKVTDTWTGTLLPNATLSIWKHYQQLPYSGSEAECRVIKVTYTDGTAWTPGAAP